MEVEMF